jgi:hypothetical protein
MARSFRYRNTSVANSQNEWSLTFIVNNIHGSLDGGKLAFIVWLQRRQPAAYANN